MHKYIILLFITFIFPISSFSSSWTLILKDDTIQILDGDNTIESKILDMALFSVLLEDENKNVVTYHNNVYLQKEVIKKSK